MDILRSTDGLSPYRHLPWPVRSDTPITKWDLLGDEDRLAVEDAPMSPDNTEVHCACGVDVSTEGRFLRHYVLPDLRYWNLGECPSSGRV